jgi:hypothetical protein
LGADAIKDDVCKPPSSDGGGTGGVTVTPMKPENGRSNDRPSRCRRQRYSRLSWTPNRRAASETITPGRMAASISRNFSASV